jgi:hypothetical protein
VKLITNSIEIRDSGTCIPALAFVFEAETETEHKMLMRSGYGCEKGDQQEYIMLMKLDGLEVQCDPFKWDQHSRTMRFAHMVLTGDAKYVGEIRDDDKLRARVEALSFWKIGRGHTVIDVEWLLGLRETQKDSEFKC